MNRFVLPIVLFVALLPASVYAFTGGDKGKAQETSIVNLSIFFSSDPCKDFKTLVIPIRRVQNLIVIEARVDTVVGNFILDTGSPFLVLNKTYFRKGWELVSTQAANATGRSTSPIMQTSVNNLEIKELLFENLTADLNDLGHIENQRGVKVLGLLGVSLFTSFEMVIDLHKSLLYLHRLDKDGRVPREEKIVKSEPQLRVPIDVMRNVITLECTVGGRKLNFCLDTGAEVNTLSNQLPAKMLRSFQVNKRLVMLGAGNSRTEVLMGTLDEITVGGKSFKNQHTAITRLEDLSGAYGRQIHGILGSNFLVKGIISINFVRKELCMYPFDLSKP